jgi:hypothetical protein
LIVGWSTALRGEVINESLGQLPKKLAAGRVGRNYPCRRLAPSARDCAGVGYSASILQVSLSPISSRGLSARRVQIGTMVGFEGFEGGERGARSQTICAELKCLKCLCRDQLPIHAWPGCTHYDPSFFGACPSYPAAVGTYSAGVENNPGSGQPGGLEMLWPWQLSAGIDVFKITTRCDRRNAALNSGSAPGLQW